MLHWPQANAMTRGVMTLCVFVALQGFAGGDVTEPVQESTGSSATFANTVDPFLGEYCIRCHGSKDQSGDRRFDGLAHRIKNDDTLVDYQDILDLLNLGEMPPEDEKQPSPSERKRVINWLTKTIGRYHQQRTSTGGEAVLRRLNSREYRNTIRDLLHVDLTMFDPTETFPRDQTTEHMDNDGATLVTSGHLLARYLQAADQVINKAITPLKRPEIQTWVFRDDFRQQPEIDQVHKKLNGFEHMTLYDVPGADKPEGAYGPIHAFAEGVPFDGIYEIRLKAEAVNRLHPYDREFIGTDTSEPLRLGIVAGNQEAGNLHLPQPIEPLLAEIELADEPKWYTANVRLDAGFTPRFTFQNGLMDARNLWTRLIKKYPDQFPKKLRGIVDMRFNAIKHGKLPQIHIHEIEIKGPIYDQWPTPRHLAVFGDSWSSVVSKGSMTREELRAGVNRFATRAYRRPVTANEIQRVIDVIDARVAAGRSTIEAYTDGLKAILCSPNFLYLQQDGGDELTSYELASRLSYFLWGTAPDATLLSLAESGKIREAKVLTTEVRRMLSDPRSHAFVEGFLASWLDLRSLGATPPDRGDFGDYYRHDLESAMRRETELFTRHVIDENLSINNFIDSDFTFVNQPLAKMYGLDPPSGTQFRQVSLSDRRRGGLLGQASVLTVTANGIDTSPVVRGVWLLENILGTPPSPPPPDVEPLDPDIRGAKTIRDQLSMHRDTPSCNECHRKDRPHRIRTREF